MRLFLRSTALQLGWWLQSFTSAGRREAPLGIRRLAFLFLLFPPLLVLHLAHWLAWGIDEILFPGYRRVCVREPLFVTGVPRSGTTFVHRLLAADEQTFTTMRTWELLLATSLTERHLIHTLGALDRALGGLGARLVEALTRKLVASDLEDVHAVGVEAPEEDYLALLPAAGCFAMVLAFPASRRLWALGDLRALDPRERAEILGFYEACVRKHLFAVGSGRRFLSKNAAFGSWIPALRERFPDARFLLCIRDPLRGLSSQLSSIDEARRIFGTDPDRQRLAPRFVERFEVAYQDLHRSAEDPEAHCAVVNAEELAATPGRTLDAALARLDVEPTPTLGRALSEADRPGVRPASRHQHAAGDFGLHRGALPESLLAAYESLRARRIQPAEEEVSSSLASARLQTE